MLLRSAIAFSTMKFGGVPTIDNALFVCFCSSYSIDLLTLMLLRWVIALAIATLTELRVVTGMTSPLIAPNHAVNIEASDHTGCELQFKTCWQ
jgi:hypothetical protein